jgi:redox-sensitive bicupin YhaK (pirin superfamily)
MPQARPVAQTFTARKTLEGAGVRLHRAFGYSEIPLFDPFLMLDDFRADRPDDYLKGFPWHPHRGIETVTYMLEGLVEHADSMGHRGTVRAGGVQWMTAGSGILHQEMPKPVNGRMGGFQLWVNLPRSHKMRKPRYQEINPGDIPSVDLPGGIRIRVICGSAATVTGPVAGIVADPEFLDVTLAPGSRFAHPVRPGYLAAAYIFEGSGSFDPSGTDNAVNRTMVLFGEDGSTIDVKSGQSGVRFLYFSGKPLKEPVAWGGPIVMNTRAELEEATEELNNGTFIRDKGEES